MNRKQRRSSKAKKDNKLNKKNAQTLGIIAKNRGSEEVETLFKIGASYMQVGDLVNATETFAKVLRLKPDHIITIEQLAMASQLLKRNDAVEVFLKGLLDVDKDYARAYGYLGKFYLSEQKPEEAMKWITEGHKRFPNDPEILCAMGALYYRQGQEEEAAEYHKRAYLAERNVSNLSNWVNSKYKVESENDFVFKELKKFAGNMDKVPRHHFPSLYTALANAYDQIGDYDNAFLHYSKSAAEMRQRLNYNVKGTILYFNRIKNFFSEEYFKQSTYEGNSTSEPIFIVGMPRSGSTLIEQMLDMHSQICGVGEGAYLSNCIQTKLYLPENPEGQMSPVNRTMSSDEQYGYAELAEDYLSFLRAHNTQAKYYIDKQLAHFVWIGIIKETFPNAKIINAMRHPLDCALSCYQQLFQNTAQEFTYDLTDISLYYRCYRELMEHWHNILPGFILDVHYEDVIDNPKTQIKRVLDFIGAPFEDQCLEFHKNERFVFTASAGQINQPLYKTAMAKWKKYEKHLAPLVEGLGPYAPEESLYILEKYGNNTNKSTG